MVEKIAKLYYSSGEEILVNDFVTLDEHSGKVVFVIASDQYSLLYSRKDWSYLNTGFGVETLEYGLIYQKESDEDLVLVHRESI